MNSDLIELFYCLSEHKVTYLIIGEQAVIYHAEPRYTKDLDILTGASGVTFATAWKNRVVVEQKKVKTFFCSKADLIKMKRAAGRPQDLLDIEALAAATKGKRTKK